MVVALGHEVAHRVEDIVGTKERKVKRIPFRELDTLPGRITLGLLVLQDLFVILFLAVQPSLNDLKVGSLLLSAVRVGGLVATALVLSRFVLPPLPAPASA